jgi:hypothetical protein
VSDYRTHPKVLRLRGGPPPPHRRVAGGSDPEDRTRLEAAYRRGAHQSLATLQDLAVQYPARMVLVRPITSLTGRVG